MNPFCKKPPTRNLLREAFDAHEANMLPILEAHMTPFVASERWKNYQKRAVEFTKTEHVTRVTVSHTAPSLDGVDDIETTVTISDPSGKSTTFWCKPDGQVRSITSY